MNFVLSGISSFLTVCACGVLLRYWRQAAKSGEKGKVQLPIGLAALGIIGTVFSLVPAFIVAILDGDILLSILFVALSLLGTTLIVAFVNCRITYDENEFTAKNFFGIKRTFKYEQVTAIKVRTHETFIYVGKHRVMVDELSKGGAEFIALVREKNENL